MVANLENIQRTYNEIPNTFIVDGLRIDNYSQSENHFKHGWRDVIIPEITKFQKLSENYILEKDIVTKLVIDLSEDEIRDLTVPKQIPRMDFEMQVLITTGIEWSGILNFINSLPMSEFYKKLLIIRFNRCVVLERYSEDLNTIATMMGITQLQLDEIFINGNLKA